MNLVPLTLAAANDFVAAHHRHHRPVVGHRFSIGAQDGGVLVGAAIVGRPVARHLDDGFTAEVTRLVTDGTKNACSMLYAACWQAVATIEALQRERDFLSCLVAEWESAAMRSLLAYIEDIKPSKAILEEMAQTSKAIREAVEDHPWIKVAAKRYREYQPGEAGHHQRRAALEMKS